jgi:ubiquinone/menaquinone biosynthesis C-methylase UbiE/DNA-binding transcriptional ArsR family regulator
MTNFLKSLRLLGDSARVRLLLLLASEELSVAELQEILVKGQSHISTHLAQLKNAGLVQDRRTGKNIFYSLKPALLPVEAAMRDRLLALLEAASAEIPEVAEDKAALDLVLSKRQDTMRSYFDSLAGKFGREYLPGRSWQGLAEVLLRLLPPLVIADLGAGEGTFSQLLAHSARQVIAIDNSERMVEFGAKLVRANNLPNIEYRLGDLEALPVADGEVDLAFFSQSLHHAQHPERAVAEAARILKPSGRIAILDLRRHQFDEARELYADRWLGFTEVELRRFLETAGFSCVRTDVVHRESEPPLFETVCALGVKTF